MRTTLTFGHAAGIPLRIHLNWFITAGLVSWSLAAGYFPHHYPGWRIEIYWLAGVLTALFFFGSVLLHELGHSLVALREGVPVNSITLFIFGGVAHIGNEPETAGSEFRIVAAGPLTSLTLAAVFFLIGRSEIFGLQISSAALYLGQMNVVLALFNLLPGFPLDGGRILRSALWNWTNDFRRATRWATNAGIGVALVFVSSGIGLMVWGDLFSGGWIAFVGIYLGMAAKEGYRQVDFAHSFEDRQTGETGLHPQNLSEPHHERPVDWDSLPSLKNIGVSNTGYAPLHKAYSRVTILVQVAEPSKKRFLVSRRVEDCISQDTRNVREW
jgi:Zn-dependent protease